MVGHRFFEVRESAEFSGLREKLAVSVRRLDEILAGVLWEIAQDPYYRDEVPETSLRVIPTDPFTDAPALLIAYTIEEEENCCELQWIAIAADRESTQ